MDDETATDLPHHRVAIIGTGFAGLGAAIALDREGVDFAIFERADRVGGTWRDNSYPGCKCDVPSHLYSFSFAPNPSWSHTYSPQPEIQAYLESCAERAGVLPRIRFGHDVLDASWDEAAQRWELTTSQGGATADLLLLGNGPLSEPALPAIPGLDRFEGTAFHSARWDHGHDLTGERVAVIGTGASAVQLVPEIQPRVASLTLFQRTPPWVLPHRDRRITAAEQRLYRRVPAVQRAVRAGVYWSRELTVLGMIKRPKAFTGVAKLATRHLERQVQDPVLRAKLTPDYAPGCKRLLLSNDYYPALAAGNAEVVTEAITEVRPRSIVTADGVEHEVDTIIYGTGFRVTDNPVADKVHGKAGRSLADAWRTGGMHAHLGTTIPGFPNLFMLAGPNTGIGHTSLVVMIEAQLTYILDCLRTMRSRAIGSVEPLPEVVQAYNDEVQEKMSRTVWSTGGCRSWYMDPSGRNPTLWPDFTWRFTRMTKRFRPEHHLLTPRRPAPAGGEPPTTEKELVTDAR